MCHWRWDHGIAAEVLVLVLLFMEMGRLCKMGSCVLNFWGRRSSISDCRDVDVGTVWCVCVSLCHLFVPVIHSSHLSTAKGWSYRYSFTMSLLTHEGHITCKAFASVPTLVDLPEIQQQPGTVSNISSLQGPDNSIDLAEGCILTKSVKYTHQLAHWVNAVHSGDPRGVVSRKLIGFIHHNCLTLSLSGVSH
jgi:hypothetical protein